MTSRLFAMSRVEVAKPEGKGVNAAEQGFLVVYEFEDDDRPLIIEDDGRACYAHVRGPLGNVVCWVWLYNRVAGTEGVDPQTQTVSTNPAEYARDWCDRPLPTSAADFRASIFKATNQPTTFNVFIGDELFAVLRAGDGVGMSKLANKDGPLALRLPRPGDAFLQVVDRYLDRLDMWSIGTFLRTFAELPEPVGHLLAVYWCEAEVENGGLHQFFWNSTGVLAPEAARGYRAIGMPAMAGIVEQAMAVFGTPYPRECEVRREFLNGIKRGHRHRKYHRKRGKVPNPSVSLDDAADAYAVRMMPTEARLNLTPEPQIPGRVSYVRFRK